MFGIFQRWKRRKVHFLHIGKTGGSAIRSALKQHRKTPRYTLELHGHRVSLKDIPRGELVVFFLRDPISRFISGFYSRQRKGQPRFFLDWNDQERKIFEAFQTPNELAHALADETSPDHETALKAMKAIRHLQHYNQWYEDLDYFESRIADVLYIGFQETLDSGFHELKGILGLDESIQLPGDDVGAHRNPGGLDRTIDEAGIAALEEWYAEDIEFVSLCKNVMSGRRSAN